MEERPTPEEGPQGPPAEPERRRRRWYLWIVWGLFWLVMAPAALFLLAWAHLDSELAREAARELVNAYVSGEMAGELAIGRVEHLHRDEIVAHDVVVRDPQGREVIRGETVRIVPDLLAALDGTLRFSSARLDGGEVELIEGADSLPTFLEAFSAADPTPSVGEPFHAVVDDVHLENVTVTGELLGIQGLRVEDVVADGRMEFEENVRIELDSVTGRVVAPYPFVATIDHLEGAVDTFPEVGTSLAFRTHVEDDERIRGTFTYRLPEGAPLTDPYVMDLRLQVDGVRARRLRELELEWAEPLRGRLHGDVRFHGPPEDLRLEANVDSDGGDLIVEGHLPAEGDAEVTIQSGSLRLAEVYDGAPDIEIDGRFTIRDEEGGTTFRGDAESFMLGETRVPPAHIEGRLEEDDIRLDVARLHLETGDVIARGRVRYDGSADLEVEADLRQVSREPLVQDIFEDLGGAARFDGDLTLGPAAETLDLRGRWVLTDVRYGPARVARLVATGRVFGPLDGPEVDLGLQADGVRAFDWPMGAGTGQIAGGPTRYRTSVTLERPGQRVEMADATLLDQGGSTRVDIPTLVAELDGKRWSGSVVGLDLAEGGLGLERIQMTSGEQSLEAATRWGFARGPLTDQLVVVVQSIDLGVLKALSDSAPELEGLFDGRLAMEGDFEGHPVSTLEGHVRGLGFQDVRELQGRVMARYQRGSLTGEARLGSSARGHLQLNLQGTFDTEAPLAETYDYGAYELETKLENVDVNILQAFDLPIPDLEGRANGTFIASGSLDVFDFRGSLESDALRVDGMKPLGVRARARYADGAMIIHLNSRDELGPLADFETALLLDLTTAIQQPELVSEMLALAPWRVAVRIPPRELSTLPPRVLELLPDVSRWRGAASLTIRGGAYQPHADLVADLEWIGDRDLTLCGRDAHPRFTIRGDLSRGEGHVEVHGLIRDRRFLFAEGRGEADLAAWLADPSSFSLPPTHLEAYVERVPLQDVPYACNVAAGPATVSLVAHDLFTEDPRVEVELSSDDVVLRQLDVSGRGAERQVVLTATTDPFAVRLQSLLSQEVFATDIEANFRDGGTALVRADIPVTSGTMLPLIDTEGTFMADLDLVKTPLASVLFWMPGIGDVEGSLDGFIQADGTFDDPDIAGELAVHDGHLELQSFGQRLHGIEGTLLLEGDRFTLQNLSARDGEGLLRMAGEIRLDGIMPSGARVRLRANEFPVREEGSIMATLTGDALLRGDLSADGFDGDLDVGSVVVRLPDDPGRDPISLSPHPEIRVAGVTRETVGEDAYVMHLRVDASDGFQMKSPDFAARLTAELDVSYADPELRVGGGVAIQTGSFEVFGKRFEVERAWMAFDGGTTLDPQVNLVAVHELRGRPGETVTVTAGGRLSNPTIQFSSTVTNDRAQIIALLVSGGNVREDTERDASRQAADFLAGVAAGVLTLSLREEFGSYFPTIAVESNQLGGTRIRSGVSFGDLLPEAVRDVIQGVYFEGYLNTANQQGTASTGQVQDYGVRLDLDFPRGVSNSYTFGGPSSWGIDVTWQP